MIRSAAALTGTLVLLSLSAAGPATAATRGCGTVSGGVAMYDITATGVTCASARKTARAWRTALLADRCVDGRFRCKVRGYTCRAKRPAQVHYPVTCASGKKRVRWEIHAD
jgi:hypothetical protein